jgi:hypothetical protein
VSNPWEMEALAPAAPMAEPPPAPVRTEETEEDANPSDDEETTQSGKKIKDLKKREADALARARRSDERAAKMIKLCQDQRVSVPPELMRPGGDDAPGVSAVVELPQTPVFFDTSGPVQDGELHVVLRLHGQANVLGSEDAEAWNAGTIPGHFGDSFTRFPHVYEDYLPLGKSPANADGTGDLVANVRMHAAVQKRGSIVLTFVLVHRETPEIRVDERQLRPDARSVLDRQVGFALDLVYDHNGVPVKPQDLVDWEHMPDLTDPPLDQINSPQVNMEGGRVTFHINTLYALSGKTKPKHRRFRFRCRCTHPELKQFRHLTAYSPPFYSIARSKTVDAASKEANGGRGRGRGGRGGGAGRGRGGRY